MMINFLISYILGFIILFSYIIYIIWKDKKIPQSISATVYSLDKKSKWLYTIVILSAAFLIAPYLFEITSAIGIEMVAYFTLVGILGVGVCPLIYGEKNTLHYVCAILMGASSQVISYLLCPYTMFLWLPYIIYTLYMDNGRWNMMFGEIVMVFALLICGVMRFLL